MNKWFAPIIKLFCPWLLKRMPWTDFRLWSLCVKLSHSKALTGLDKWCTTLQQSTESESRAVNTANKFRERISCTIMWRDGVNDQAEVGRNSRNNHQHPVTGVAVKSSPFNMAAHLHTYAHTHWGSGVSGTCLRSCHVSDCLPLPTSHNAYKHKSTHSCSQEAGS